MTYGGGKSNVYAALQLDGPFRWFRPLALPLFEADRDDRIFARSNVAPVQKQCDEVVAPCNEREKSIYLHSPIFTFNS
jgi:hypothetical protein